ncbi:MAG: hypothetical protein AB1507_01100 [Bacillota bacterium]|jgi:hypothetical protein|nr:hypothetical protein [Thermoanaerobacteraceae bacterium]
MSITKEEIAAGGLTYEEYLLIPDDGRRHELIGGIQGLFVKPLSRRLRTDALLL